MVKIELTQQEEMLLAESKHVNTESIDAYWNGQLYLDQIDKDALQRAAEHFNTAIEKDPGWAPPYAGLAEVGVYQKQMGFVSQSVADSMIHENINTALKLDSNSSNSHYVNAVIAVWTEWNWEKGEKEFKRALDLNPNNALCRMFYAHLLMILLRFDEAVTQSKLALEQDPTRPFILGLYAVVMQSAGDYQSAIDHADKSLKIDADHYFAKNALANAYYFNRDYGKSFELLKQSLKFEDEVVSAIEKTFNEQGYFAALEEIISAQEEASQEKFIQPVDFAMYYYRVKKYNKALDWLEKAYEIKDPNLPYISEYWDALRDNQRFIDLLTKINLPLKEN